MSELLEAFKMLGDGITKYQTTQAVNDATEQLNIANSKQLDEQQRLVETTKIGQGLALRLTAAGADPGHISAATAGLMPSASMQAQNFSTVGLENTKTKAQKDIEQMKVASAKDIEQMKVDAAMGKQGTKVTQDMMKFGTEFGAQKQIKPILEGLPKLDKALESIQANKGQEGVTAVVELAKLGAIRDAAGRVNEKEIEAANESPSMRAQLWKRAGLETTGETPANVQEFWIKYLSQQKQAATQHISDSIEGFAQSKATLNDKIDSNRVKTALKLQYGIKDRAPASAGSSSNPNAAAIAAATAWLAQNPNDPNAAAVKQKVIKMQGPQ